MFNFNKKCNCENYKDLELTRGDISKRIKKNKKIYKNLSLLATSESTTLYNCNFCGQYWQNSLAWNWDGQYYFFKIPEIKIEEWMDEQFVSPADLVIHLAMMQHFYDENEIKERDIICRRENCQKNAIEGSVLCERHHIISLQNFGMLPRRPVGRFFKPYKKGV